MTVHSAKDDRSLSYVAALSDRLWLLMIDVNAVTQPGSVPSETLAWIADQLEQAKRSGCPGHRRQSSESAQSQQPDFNGFHHRQRRSAARSGNRMAGFVPFERTYPYAHMAKSASGLCDIATSSLAVSPNQYGVLMLSSDKAAYRTESVDVSSWARLQG